MGVPPLRAGGNFLHRRIQIPNKSIIFQRIRKRGPRSHLALLRRSLPKRCRALPGIASGESEASVPDNLIASSQQIQNPNLNLMHASTQNDTIPASKTKKKKEEITILVVNIQSVRAHLVELA